MCVCCAVLWAELVILPTMGSVRMGTGQLPRTCTNVYSLAVTSQLKGCRNLPLRNPVVRSCLGFPFVVSFIPVCVGRPLQLSFLPNRMMVSVVSFFGHRLFFKDIFAWTGNIVLPALHSFKFNCLVFFSFFFISFSIFLEFPFWFSWRLEKLSLKVMLKIHWHLDMTENWPPPKITIHLWELPRKAETELCKIFNIQTVNTFNNSVTCFCLLSVTSCGVLELFQVIVITCFSL